MYALFRIKFIACFKMSIFQIIFACIFANTFAAPQTISDKQAEIPDQFENHPEANHLHKVDADLIHDPTTASPDTSTDTTATTYVENFKVPVTRTTPHKEMIETTTQQPFTTKLYTIVALPIKKFIASPKVNTVLRNIGTCVVNGAMEIISHFFPTPLMPLIASAAGMIIPFEPIVLLKERMPVASYRRAIKTAVNSFMDTFDKYKVEDEYVDPYMTRRFNRRFMNDKGDKTKVSKLSKRTTPKTFQ